ncbi:hypothetical protein R1flu_001281 [Riccia fluitans]|uniref:Major facilitator superfamily (MFS) profile domain-containing protein n=1 Tax=Riccia fluitans TaxID=41844 RepID=A0ABD1Y369_9MARC
MGDMQYYKVMKEKFKTVSPLAPLLCALFVNMAGFSSVLPSVPDVLISVICPGRLECNQLIFLSGLQTTLTGIGAMVVAPILGWLSDDYGRKPAFLLVLISSIPPPLLLAYSSGKMFLYMWWVLQLFAYILREAGLGATTFAMVADIFPDPRKRAPAIGIAMSMISIGMLMGTLCARVLRTEQLFIFSAVLQIISAAIVKVFLTESHPNRASSHRDIEKLTPLISKGESKSIILETIGALRNNKQLRIMAAVALMVNLTETTLESTLFLYLKAVFSFGKDQFAQFNIFIGIVGFVSQMVAYPILANSIGERKVLWLALLGGAVNVYVYAFAWADWVPYLGCGFVIFYSMIPAAIGTVVSRGATQEQQGKVQGLIVSVRTVAFILGPIALTPLTAMFLSEDPPFHAPGFTLMIGGTAMVLAFLLALRLPELSASSGDLIVDEIITSSSEEVKQTRGKEDHVSIDPLPFMIG